MERKLAIQRAKTNLRGCLVTGLRVMHGNNVSHSNRKVKRLFKANISKKTIISESLGAKLVRISRRGERTIEKYGGLDKFLATAKNRKLTMQAMILKRELMVKLGENQKTA